MSDDLRTLLKKCLPPEILGKIVFLKEFIPPPDFFSCTVHERMRYLGQYSKYEVEPTETNNWIWFGAYSSRDNHPIFYNERVVRKIYHIMINPLVKNGKKQKLMTSFVETNADVNPYKFVASHGKKYYKETHVSELMGFKVDHSKLAINQMKTRDETLIKVGINLLKENSESFTDEEGWRFVLEQFQQPSHLFDKIIERYKNEHNIQSDRNPKGDVSDKHGQSSISDTQPSGGEPPYPTQEPQSDQAVELAQNPTLHVDESK